MEEQLIELSKQKGFKSIVFSDLEITSKLNFFLWLCELQKWIREEHNIEIMFDLNDCRYFFKIKLIKNKYGLSETITQFSKPFNTYEQALEQGLKESLKLILTMEEKGLKAEELKLINKD